MLHRRSLSLFVHNRFLVWLAALDERSHRWRAFPDNSWPPPVPSHRCSGCRCQGVALFGALRWPPFFRELRIKSLSKPAFLLAPLQAFLLQDLEDARLLHVNTQMLANVGCQPLKRPTAVA